MKKPICLFRFVRYFVHLFQHTVTYFCYIVAISSFCGTVVLVVVSYYHVFFFCNDMSMIVLCRQTSATKLHEKLKLPGVHSNLICYKFIKCIFMCDCVHASTMDRDINVAACQDVSHLQPTELYDGKERKVYGFNVQFKSWFNQLSLSHESSKKMKGEKQSKKLMS